MKAQGKTVILKVSGMHCVSCGMNIDGELEDTAGVHRAQTSYAQSQTTITYNPDEVRLEELKKVIESLDYRVAEGE